MTRMLPVDVDGLSRRPPPVESARVSRTFLAKLIRPVILTDYPRHRLSPTRLIQRRNKVGMRTQNFPVNGNVAGDDRPPRRQHFHRRQAEAFEM